MHRRPEGPAIGSALAPVRELNDIESCGNHGSEREIAVCLAFGPTEMASVRGMESIESIVGIGRILIPDLVSELPVAGEEVGALYGTALEAGIRDETPKR